MQIEIVFIEEKISHKYREISIIDNLTVTRTLKTGAKISRGANASVMSGHSAAGAGCEIIAAISFVSDFADISA